MSAHYHRARAAALACLFAMPAAAQTEPRISRGEIAAVEGAQRVLVADDLRQPWAIAWLPDGRAVITQKGGTLRLMEDGAVSSAAIDFPVDVTSGGEGGGQGGLLDVAVHPDFADNKLLYFSYSVGGPDANRTAIGRAKFDGETLRDFERIYQNPNTKQGGQHFGSRLLFLPDGTLLASIGDGGNPPISFQGMHIRHQAQNLGTVFGSVIRLNDDGTVPKDNPFVGDAGVRPEIWTYGHRNIQGLSRDPETGAVWATEHGAAAGDELNQLAAGKNYGWPDATFSRNYRDGSLISERIGGQGFTDPAVVWLDTHSPSGLWVYRGVEFEEWQGYALSGGLVSHDLRLIDMSGDGAPTEKQLDIGARVRDVRVGPEGGLFVLTDGDKAKLLRIEPVD